MSELLTKCPICSAGETTRADHDKSLRELETTAKNLRFRLSYVEGVIKAHREAASQRRADVDFRKLELRDTDGILVCDQPIHQPQVDEIHRFVIFNGTRLFKYGYRYIVGDEVEVANYREESALRCGRAVVTDQLTVWQPGLPPSPVFVLACVEDDRGNRTVVRAAYVRQFELVANLEECGDAVEYREEDDEYYCPEGWFEMNSFEETHWRVESRVVGWMSLPSPSGEAIEGVEQAAIVEALTSSNSSGRT